MESKGAKKRGAAPAKAKTPLWTLFDKVATVRGDLAHALLEYGVETVAETEGDRLMVRRINAAHSHNIHQCAQMIIATGDHPRVVSMMPPIPLKVTDRNIGFIRANFVAARVTALDDGSTIGLYWHNERWNIRTKKGFMVDHLNHVAGHTFGEILADALAKYPNFRLDRLNRDRCYTLGIKNSKFHPFREGSPNSIIRAWFIQSVNLKSINANFGHVEPGAILDDDSIGLPLQTPVHAPLNELLENTRSAIDRWKSHGIVDYGYLIRINSQSFILQSDLFASISNVCYVDAGITRGDTPDTIEWMLLNAILSDVDHLTDLYPEYNDFIAEAFATIGLVATTATSYVTNPTKGEGDNSMISQIASQFASIWRHRFGSIADNDISIGIAKMIHNKRYAGVLYELLIAMNIAP